MKVINNKQEWNAAPIGDFQYNLATGEGYLLWGDEINNTWLEANIKNPVFVKQSNYPRDWELVFAAVVSIYKIPVDKTISYLRDLGYKAVFQEKWPALYHLCIESEVTLDIVCEDINISENKKNEPPFV